MGLVVATVAVGARGGASVVRRSNWPGGTRLHGYAEVFGADGAFVTGGRRVVAGRAYSSQFSSSLMSLQ